MKLLCLDSSCSCSTSHWFPETDCFPHDFKNALVRPLLKKDVLDAGPMKNYRPVSNFLFLSKLLETAVQSGLQEFLDSNNTMPKEQSGYRRYHSTETAATKVYNDLLLAADDGDVTALCLLDLTAALDTVDHDLLILRLERQFGLRGVVLKWFRSYLTGRIFQVVYAGKNQLWLSFLNQRFGSRFAFVYFIHGGPRRCSLSIPCHAPCTC